MSKVYQPHDRFFQKAKAEGYRARSAYKLEAIQNRFHLIKRGDRVLDLGAAPGSFLQVITKIVGSKGLAVGVDLKSIKPLGATNVFTLIGDIFDESVMQKVNEKVGQQKFDVITSDLAPATTGIKSVDAGRSFQLNEQVLAIAQKHLKPGGHLVIKAFPGADHTQLLALAKKHFRRLQAFQPPAVRQTSRELYLIGVEYHQQRQ